MDPQALYLIVMGRMHVTESRISANDVKLVTESDGAEIVKLTIGKDTNATSVS